MLACHENDLVRAAQVVLPMAAWAEIHGTMTNAQGFVQRLNAALVPAGDARAGWEIASSLATRLGHQLKWNEPRAVFRELIGTVPQWKDAEWGRTAIPVQLRFAGSRG